MRKNAFIVCAVMATTAGIAHADNVQIVNNLPGAFVDISGTGTALNLTDDGLANINTTVSNGLLSAGGVRISNNGGAAWGIAAGTLAFTNVDLLTGAPAFGSQAEALLPYWDDLDSEQGNVYWQEIGGNLIIQWHNRPHFPGSTTANTCTFQIQVFGGADGVATPYAQYIYSDVDFGDALLNDGASATIGYQSTVAAEDNQWSFNTAGSVTNGTVLSIVVPSPGALALLGLAGVIGSRRRRN